MGNYGLDNKTNAKTHLQKPQKWISTIKGSGATILNL